MKKIIAIVLAAGLASNAVLADLPVTIKLGPRHGHATPCRQGFAHTGGGNIDVAQPAADTIVVTMTGVAVAGGHPCKNSMASLQFDLDQSLDVLAADAQIHRVKLVMEARTIGLLRSHRHGGGVAEQGPGSAFLRSGPNVFAEIAVPSHSVNCGNSLSLNCKEGPIEQTIMTGVRYHLHQNFSVMASHPQSLLPCKTASAEFAPEPALDPLWISYWEPFRGANKKVLGFQVILRVFPENGECAKNK